MAAPVVVRVAGLPVAALERLRCEKAFARLCTVVELRRRLAAEGDALSAELYPVIGAESADRAALVGLRRKVFQVRMPTGREWNAQVAALLPGELADRVHSWIATLTDYEGLNSGLEDILTSEIESTREALREAAGHRNFQRALSYASPALSGETAKWLADPSRHLRRQSQVRLAKYVARAVAKTSPYSTFTISGAGVWSEDGPGTRLDESARVKGVPEVMAPLTGGLMAALSEDVRLAAKLPIRLNPSAIVHGRTVRFLGPPPVEKIVTVPAAPAVLECLRILEGGARYTMGELRDLLNDGDDDDERIEQFIAYLLENGLLQRRFPIADLTGDPLGELAGWLEANAGEDFAGVLRLLHRARSLLRERVPASAQNVQRGLDDTLLELAHAAGLKAERGKAELFRDNAVFTGTAARLAMPRWRPALEDLNVVRKVLGALDPSLPIRIGLAAYCADRFGPGARIPLLVLHEAIAEDLASDEAERGHGLREIAQLLQVKTVTPDDLPDTGHLPLLRELSEIRQGLRAVIDGSALVDGVVRVEPDALARLSASWPEWVTAPPSVACYVQTVDDGEALRLVLNAVDGGFGRGRSRALHLMRQADEAVSWEIGPPSEADEPVIAELCGLFNFTPNVRLPSVPYEIDYPFTESDRPAEQRIPLSDLEVVQDGDQVYLAEKGKKSQITAQHLGMMSDFFLPPAARLIARAFGSSYFTSGIVALFTSSEAPGGPVQALPRVEIGGVVLRRARWTVPTKYLPVRGKGESDSAYLIRLVTWLRAHDIPTRCFVRMLSDTMLDPDGESATKWFDKSRKPVYVDFANWYLVSAFERMLRGTGLAIFEEALPALEDAGAKVMEFIVEISGTRD